MWICNNIKKASHFWCSWDCKNNYNRHAESSNCFEIDPSHWINLKFWINNKSPWYFEEQLLQCRTKPGRLHIGDAKQTLEASKSVESCRLFNGMQIVRETWDHAFTYLWLRTNSTGWPKSKFANLNGYNSENMHFWPHVGKAKMCFGGLHLFFKIVNKQLKTENKCRPPKHILALPTQHGVRNAYFQSYSHLN